MIEQVLYLAAHGGFAGQAVPLGGGAAIANQLQEEWERTRPFALRMVTPAILGEQAPSAQEIVRYNERAYARFCHAFREAATREVLQHEPGRNAVLVNDISEGPDFERLRAAGFRVLTIWHVDVVAYIADIYLSGRVRAEKLASWWERGRKFGLARAAPEILRLIFEQQRASLEHSEAVVVPSGGMRELILRSYAWTQPQRVRVLPWGVRLPEFDEAEVHAGAERLREEFGIRGGERVLLCLSRISPEKGQDLLLEALRGWTGPPLLVLICGEAAFMGGERHLQRLRRLAEGLNNVRVLFPGYAQGIRKSALFRLADLYVFPSRHESYGLTLMEALASGLPAVCLESAGTREVMREEFGAMVAKPADLPGAIARLLAEGDGLRQRGRGAAEFARRQDFRQTAAKLAEWLCAPVAGI